MKRFWTPSKIFVGLAIFTGAPNLSPALPLIAKTICFLFSITFFWLSFVAYVLRGFRFLSWKDILRGESTYLQKCQPLLIWILVLMIPLIFLTSKIGDFFLDLVFIITFSLLLLSLILDTKDARKLNGKFHFSIPPKGTPFGLLVNGFHYLRWTNIQSVQLGTFLGMKCLFVVDQFSSFKLALVFYFKDYGKFEESVLKNISEDHPLAIFLKNHHQPNEPLKLWLSTHLPWILLILVLGGLWLWIKSLPPPQTPGLIAQATAFVIGA